MSCSNNDKPNCCGGAAKSKGKEKDKDGCSLDAPTCSNLPNTLTFKCPAEDCAPKAESKPACSEKKDNACVCVGKCDDKKKC